MEITFDDPHTDGPGDDRPRDDRGQNRKRWIAGVAAAMLVAAAGGAGYGIGRSVDADDAGAGAATAEPDAAAETTAALPDSEDDAGTTATTVVIDGDVGFGTASADAGTSISASGGMGWSSFGGQPVSPVFERVTGDGYTLRAALGEPWDEAYSVGEVGGWQPAPWCYESGQVRVALGGNGVIDVGSAPWYREPYQGRSVSTVSLGAVDGAPRWVVVVQTPPGTSSVGVRFDSGATDSTAPQNDIAVLSVPGSPPTEVDEGGSTYLVVSPPVFDVTFEGPDGATEVASSAIGSWDDPEFRASCEPPPPALPDPGEQPADPAAAEAAIVGAMTALYDSTVLLDEDVVHLDDATGVAEARDAVAEGSYSAEAASSVAVVEELVFTSPTEAWFRYRIDTDGVGLTNRYGIAIETGGVWKITRSTLCQDLAMAGGDCGGGWQSIRPPGADGMDGYGEEMVIQD